MQLVLQRGKADVPACVSRVLTCHNDVDRLDLRGPVIGFEGDSLRLGIKSGSRELVFKPVLTQPGRLGSDAGNVTAAHLVKLAHTQPSYLIPTSDPSRAAQP